MTHSHAFRLTSNLLYLLLIMGYSFLLFGCGGGGGNSTPHLVSITISPEGASLMVGESIQLNAEGTYNNNETNDITNEVYWESSDEVIATIENDGDDSGLLTALSAGEITITAVLNDLEASLDIKINTITWTTSVTGGYALEAECIRQTSDGGFILTGRKQQDDHSWDIYIMKLDEYGNILWENTYGGSGDDTGKGVIEMDGASATYIVAGQITLSDTTSDIYLLGTDSTGAMLWEKTYGGPYEDVANSIQTTADGNLIIAGSTEKVSEFLDNYNEASILKDWDVYLLKTDKNGALIWEATIVDDLSESVISSEKAKSVRQVAEGGFIIAGSVDNVSSLGDFYLLRTDEAGIPLWQQTFGFSYSTESGFDVLEAPLGGFIMVGVRSYIVGPGELGCLTIKTDGDGNQEWSDLYNQSVVSSTRYAITPAADGDGYVITGDTYAYSTGSRDVSLFKIDDSGEILWKRLYGDQSADISVSLQQTADGGYIVASNSTFEESEGILILKTDGNGNIDGLIPNPE